MYNLVSLNSLEFTELVARRLILKGKGPCERIRRVPNLTRGQEPLIYPHTHTHNTPAPKGLSRGVGQDAGSLGRDVSGSMVPSLTGFPQTTLAVLFVTYCGVQLVKERERTLALEEEQKQDKEKPE